MAQQHLHTAVRNIIHMAEKPALWKYAVTSRQRACSDGQCNLFEACDLCGWVSGSSGRVAADVAASQCSEMRLLPITKHDNTAGTVACPLNILGGVYESKSLASANLVSKPH